MTPPRHASNTSSVDYSNHVTHASTIDDSPHDSPDFGTPPVIGSSVHSGSVFGSSVHDGSLHDSSIHETTHHVSGLDADLGF